MLDRRGGINMTKILHQYPLKCWTLHEIYTWREHLSFHLFFERWEEYQKNNVSNSIPRFCGEQSLLTLLTQDQYVGAVVFDMVRVEIVGHFIGQVTDTSQLGVRTFTEKTRRITNTVVDSALRYASEQSLRDVCFAVMCDQYLSHPTPDGQPYVLKWHSLYPGKTMEYSVESGLAQVRGEALIRT